MGVPDSVYAWFDIVRDTCHPAPYYLNSDKPSILWRFKPGSWSECLLEFDTRPPRPVLMIPYVLTNFLDFVMPGLPNFIFVFAGLPDNVTARDIVDGHMEKTLNLLWHIIFGFQVSLLVSKLQKPSEYRIPKIQI